MPEWLVRWEIDIEAETAEEAARQALAIQRDPESIALVFEVTREGSDKTKVIDLWNEV